MYCTSCFALCINLREEATSLFRRNTGSRVFTHTCALFFGQYRPSKADDVVVDGVAIVEKDADLVPAACQSEKHARGTNWPSLVAFHMAVSTLHFQQHLMMVVSRSYRGTSTEWSISSAAAEGFNALLRHQVYRSEGCATDTASLSRLVGSHEPSSANTR